MFLINKAVQRLKNLLSMSNITEHEGDLFDAPENAALIRKYIVHTRHTPALHNDVSNELSRRVQLSRKMGERDSRNVPRKGKSGFLIQASIPG